MTWEAVGALGSISSAVVIAATAVFGYRQLRALRLAAQLEGFLQIQRELDSEVMNDARSFVTFELPELLKNEQFREELASGRIDRRRHKEILLGNFMNSIGMLVSYGALDDNLFTEYYAYIAPHAWEDLRPVVELVRRKAPRTWNHFEYLVRKCEERPASSLKDKAFSPQVDPTS